MKWKHDAPYVLCLSHDVDRTAKQWYHYCYYGLKHPVVQIKSLVHKLTGKEPYWNFEEIMELEKSHGVRSTFFFLNESRWGMSADFMGRYKITAGRIVEMIQSLDKEDFEIGLHGSFDSYNNLDLFQKEKAVLEQIVGHQVVSARQHHLNFDAEKTWEYHKRTGIRFDSTVGYSDKIGTDPYRRTAEGIIEIPITLMDTVTLTESIFDECCNIAKDGGIIMLNFHQCHFNKLEYPRNVEVYTRLIKKAKCDGAWIANVRETGEWLDERI